MNRFAARTGILLLYCLPPLLAVGYHLHAYRARALDVVDELQAYAQQIESDPDGEANAVLADNELSRQLVTLYTKQRALGVEVATDRAHFEVRVLRLWAYNSSLIAGLTLLPFLLLGGPLAFDDRLDLGLAQRTRAATSGWQRKLLLGFVIALGWVYVLNPLGRGASIAYDFVLSSDAVSMSTLPIYIDARDFLSHTMCGFLGWYLHLLGYVFRKSYLSDVVSHRVYSLFFRKLLFVYGIALIVTSVAADQAKVVTFLIGFFPLSALSLLKDAGVKALEGVGGKESSLLDLPLISRWEALRLEEEGIETVPALAMADRAELARVLPVEPRIVALWIDAARLAAIAGPERYGCLRRYCSTASELERRIEDAAFVAKLDEECGVANPTEMVTLLRTTFA